VTRELNLLLTYQRFEALKEGENVSEENEQFKLSRRRFLEAGSAAFVAAAGLQAQGQQGKINPMGSHTGVNASQPGPKNNTVLDAQNEDSAWPPETDSGGQPPFKYSFSLSHKRIEDGGWTRQVTVRDLPVSKTMAGVEMRLISGGIRELHWHVASEWALMLYGSARITAVDQQGRAFVEDVNAGDLWLFPGGIPSRAWGRMDASFCWCSRMATSMSSERFY
jgi:oxalate decarboxylase